MAKECKRQYGFNLERWLHPGGLGYAFKKKAENPKHMLSLVVIRKKIVT